MYLDFYGFREEPFSATPDPRFLFLAPAHREALAQLIYGVQEGKGFLVLTGEVGTGKTTLLHAMLARVSPDTAVAFILNSTMSFDDILEYALEDFGIRSRGHSRARRLFALNNFLIERRGRGQQTVLIVDEAQNLTPETLEQVRLLSNFETPSGKLLQILLVGQPELREMLARPELRQLKQRIGLRCTIGELTAEETFDYVKVRLRVAGGRDLRLFSEGALARIADYTRGTPRLINLVCDHCLLSGYAEQTRRIERDTVERAIAYLEDGVRPGRPGGGRRAPAAPRLSWVLGGLGAAAVGGLALLGVSADQLGGAFEALRDHILSIAREARSLVTR